MKSIGLSVIAVLFLCGTVYAERTIWYVHPDSALNTIQAGLDSCADNDIVLVGPGTYYENIVWPARSGIHLIGELGRDVTFIDGSNAAPVFTIWPMAGGGAVVRGFTIRNGHSGISGGGIHAGADFLEILDNTFINNSATEHGGAIYYVMGPVEIGRNLFTNNTAGMDGGAIIFADAFGDIYDNTINYNTAMSDGGGICIAGLSSARIWNNTICHNSAGDRGGGIETHGWLEVAGVDSLVGNTITENSAQYGGGCRIHAGYTYGNTISYNTASVDGGGMVITPPIEAGTTYVRKNAITHNSAGNHGSGICAVTYDTMTFAIIDSNNIYNNGSGLYNPNIEITFNAEYNWWGDATGPYHPTANPGGLGDTVSDYVDFDPWLTIPGVEEQPIVKSVEAREHLHTTIFHGSLQLPEGKKCKVFDITGRVVAPDKIQPGIYFIEIDGVVTQKVVKVR